MTRNQIIELYTATFNRAADADGVAYWETQTHLTQTQMANAFVISAEAVALYPSTQTNTEYVESIYTNLFGRAADEEGLAYWLGKLDSGELRKEDMIVATVNGALGDDQTILDNKTAASAHAVSAGSNDKTVSLSSVTKDAATVTVVTDAIDAAINADQDGIEQVGSTIAFTTAIDALVGTANNDTFIGQVAAGATNTVVAADQVAGGAGTDTVKIYGDAATQVMIPSLNSIETLWLNNLDEADNYDFSAIAGLTTIEIDSLEDINGGAAARTYTIAEGQKIILDSVTDSTAGTESVDISTTATTLDLGLDGTFAGTVNAQTEIIIDSVGANVTTLNIDAINNRSTVDIDSTGGATVVKTVNVTGDAQLGLDIDALTAVTTYDASAATGNISVDLSNITNALTATGSQGDDTIVALAAQNVKLDTGAGDDYVNVGATLTAADVIKGGEGTDTLGMTAAAAGAMDDKTAAHNLIQAAATGFEQLRLTDDMNGTTTDISAFGMNYLQIATEVTTADATVNGFTSGATVELRDATDAVAGTTAGYVIGMTGATAAGTPNDTLNIKLNANIVTASAVDFDIAAAGVNIYNITATDQDNGTTANANGAGGYVFTAGTVTAGADASLNTVNIDGDAAVSYTVSATADALATIDGSASTGVLTIDATTSFDGTQGIVISGGSRADTITGSANADTITSGEGADILGLAGGDTVTDFTVGASGDVIDLSIAGNSVGVNLITDADATAKVISATSTGTQAHVSGDTLFLSVEKAEDFDSIDEIGALFATGKAFAAAANAGETTLIIAAADTGDSYIYDITEVGNNGLSTGADTATLVATLTGVTSSDLDSMVAANFQA